MSIVDTAPAVAGTPNATGGLFGVYRESGRRMRASASLRHSFTVWTGGGLVFTFGLSLLVALLHDRSLDSAAWALVGSLVWCAIVSVVVFGGAALLREPVSAAPVNRYGIPNGLTALRTYACLPLLLMAALTLPGRSGLLMWCFIGWAVGTLDAVDGFVARRYGPLTELGKAMDPASDAVYFSVASVGNIWLGILPIWVSVLTLVRYLGPLLLTPVVLLMRRRPELVHTKWGRRNTMFTAFTMFVCMFVRIFDGPVDTVASVLAVVLLIPTTLLHSWSLIERISHAPVAGRT